MDVMPVDKKKAYVGCAQGMESSLKGRAAFLGHSTPEACRAIGEGPWPVPFKVKLGQTWRVFSVEHPGQACPSLLSSFLFQNKSLFLCPAHIFVDYLEVSEKPQGKLSPVTSHMGS